MDSPDWTGFYVGGQLGSASIDTVFPGVEGTGFISGVTLGYDYDLGDWVVGASLEYDWMDIELSTLVPLEAESVWRAKLRGGYKLGDGLFYGAAGLSGADTNIRGYADGGFVGVGYEHMVMENFSVGVEAQYHQFEDFRLAEANPEASVFQFRAAYRF